MSEKEPTPSITVEQYMKNCLVRFYPDRNAIPSSWVTVDIAVEAFMFDPANNDIGLESYTDKYNELYDDQWGVILSSESAAERGQMVDIVANEQAFMSSANDENSEKVTAKQVVNGVLVDREDILLSKFTDSVSGQGVKLTLIKGGRYDAQD